MQETFIAGKDSSLENSIEHFQSILKKINLDVEEVSWLNPVPHVWSVHLRAKNCPICFSNGKGSSQKAALASALGEFIERLATNYFFADFYLGEQIAHSPFVHYPNEKWFPFSEEDMSTNWKKGLLNKKLWQYYDPEHLLVPEDMIDLQSGATQRGICALPFIEQSTQKKVYFPVNIIGNLYVSNGMAAGNSRYEAYVQAFSEIFERYVKNKIIAEGISLPEIPLDVLNQNPNIKQAIDELEMYGFPVICFDASLGGRYPVICIVLLDPKSGGCFASFGAHPNFSVALERTLTELLQGRQLDQLHEFTRPSFRMDLVSEHTNLETHFIDSSGLIAWRLFSTQKDYTFCPWNFTGTTEQEFKTLLELCHSHDLNVYIADYNYLGVHVCRILVPELSEIYPIEDLYLANNNRGNRWREIILSLPAQEFTKNEYAELFDELTQEIQDDSYRVREFLGLATKYSQGWANLRVGELKAMLALAAENVDEALIGFEWALHFNPEEQNNEQRQQRQCLLSLLEFQLEKNPDECLEEYLPIFEKLFSTAILTKALDQLSGKNIFSTLCVIDKQFTQLPLHHGIITTYKNLQKLK